MKFFEMLERTTRFSAFRQNLFGIGIGLFIASVDLAHAIETKIAFMSTRDGNAEIYVMDTDGAAPVRLTKHPAIDSYPAWTPDGSKIAFTSNRRNGSTHEIYITDADGKDTVRLTKNNQPVPAYDESPSWSPDGSYIAFTSLRNLVGEELFLMNPDGTNVIQLTHGSEQGMNRMSSWRPAPQAVSSKEKLATQLGRVKQSR